MVGRLPLGGGGHGSAQEDFMCLKGLSPWPRLLRLCSRAFKLQLLKSFAPRDCALRRKRPPQWGTRPIAAKRRPGSLQPEKGRTRKGDPAQPGDQLTKHAHRHTHSGSFLGKPKVRGAIANRHVLFKKVRKALQTEGMCQAETWIYKN